MARQELVRSYHEERDGSQACGPGELRDSVICFSFMGRSEGL